MEPRTSEKTQTSACSDSLRQTHSTEQTDNLTSSFFCASSSCFFFLIASSPRIDRSWRNRSRLSAGPSPNKPAETSNIRTLGYRGSVKTFFVVKDDYSFWKSTNTYKSVRQVPAVAPSLHNHPSTPESVGPARQTTDYVHKTLQHRVVDCVLYTADDSGRPQTLTRFLRSNCARTSAWLAATSSSRSMLSAENIKFSVTAG